MNLPKVGRNDPCPCGSGKKYKNCHYGQETKKTYTTSGKRKFKAKILTGIEKSKDIFQLTPPAATSSTQAENLEDLKVKLTEHDFRVKTDQAPLRKFETTQQTPEAKPFELLQIPEGEFKPTSQDFQVGDDKKPN